jgi:EmrB/QacA subfamily drug resistance transporter
VKDDYKKWKVLMVVLVGSFMTTLDINIVNVALPKISDSLSVGINSIQWVVTSYLIAVSSLVLIFGRISDIIGKKKIYQKGFIVFSVGSFFCVLSTNMIFLIIARVIQGVGASMMMSCNFGIITMSFPKNERGRAVGILGTVVAIGTMTGPPLGGILVSMFKWQSIFIINIPIGLGAYFIGAKLLPMDEKSENEEVFDIKGAVLFSISIITLFYSLSAGESISFNNPSKILSFILFILSFLSFILVELHVKAPMVDFELFKNKLFSAGIFCAFISYFVIYFTNIIQPFYLQHILNMSPERAGLIMTVYPVTAAVVAPISGYMSDKIGYKLPCLIGLISTCLGIYSMSYLTINSSYLAIMLPMSLLGSGYGMFQSPNTAGVMSSVPKDKLGITGSMNSLIRNLGMTFGISISTSLFYSLISIKIGHSIIGTSKPNSDIFIYAMRSVYVIGAILAIPGILVGAFRKS